MFGVFSRQTVKAVCRPGLRLSTSRDMHSMQAPFSGPPSYDTIARRLSSSQVDPQAFFRHKRQQEAKDRGEFSDIHDVDPDYSPGPNEYDVLLSDVTYEKLSSSIAEELGIAYLSKATDAKEVIQVGNGYIYGLHKRTIVPFVVSYKKEARWVFFIVDTGSPCTYLSTQASKVFGIEDEVSVTIAGRVHVAHVPLITSHYSDVNILGTDFFFQHKIIKVEDYVNRRAKLFFGFDADWELVEKPKL